MYGGRKTTSARTPCCSGLAEGDTACYGMLFSCTDRFFQRDTRMVDNPHHRGGTGGRQEDVHNWAVVDTCLCKKVDEYHKVVVDEEQ